MNRNPVKALMLFLRAIDSARRADRSGNPGMMFDKFGRQFGWKLIIRRIPGGFTFLINPVSSFRYYEFPFSLSILPPSPGRCLDVSSPALFSFYISQNCHPSSIWMINPDKNDISNTTCIAESLQTTNIQTSLREVDVLEGLQEQFDCIWAISVIEHISGRYDDRHAIRLMYEALAPGGRLILTVPVDRHYWEEFRNQAYYGSTDGDSKNGKHFFQRYYDAATISNRLVKTIGVDPIKIGWYGEKKQGHFLDYEKRWIRDGFACTFNDPLEMAENYQEFSSWETMPGKGVCGMAFQRPG